MKLRHTITTIFLLLALALAPLEALLAMQMGGGHHEAAAAMADCDDGSAGHVHSSSVTHDCADGDAGASMCDDGPCVHCAFCTAMLTGGAWANVVQPGSRPDSIFISLSSTVLPAEGRPPRHLYSELI